RASRPAETELDRGAVAATSGHRCYVSYRLRRLGLLPRAHFFRRLVRIASPRTFPERCGPRWRHDGTGPELPGRRARGPRGGPVRLRGALGAKVAARGRRGRPGRAADGGADLPAARTRSLYLLPILRSGHVRGRVAPTAREGQSDSARAPRSPLDMRCVRCSP